MVDVLNNIRAEIILIIGTNTVEITIVIQLDYCDAGTDQGDASKGRVRSCCPLELQGIVR